MKRNLLFFIVFITSTITLFSQPVYNKDGLRLYHHLTPEEAELYKTVDMSLVPTDAPVGEIRPIAEYEPMEAVLIRYPFGIPMNLIKEMAKDVKVITIVANTNEQNYVLNQYNSNGINTDNCEFLIANSNGYWTRDYGPWFMAIDNEEVAMYDFKYNRPRPNDNQVNGKLAPYLSMDIYVSNIEHCGGNFMNDGKNQAASTDLVIEENTSYTEAQIKQHYLDYMGIEQYHFVEDPLKEYIKHIDCWGKYLAPNKMIMGQVPESDWRYSIFEEVADYFASQTSAWGTPLEVYRVYTPGAQYSGGKPTPYANSLILNNKVFVALSGSQHDAAAIQSYKEAMPGYEIIGINYSNWEDTDALHCRTHEIADRCMLYVKHQPKHGEIENTGNVTFSTELYSYCDNTIYQDSVIIYLRVNGEEEYTGYNMINVDNNTWEVTIPGLPSELIEYYVFAADESGRRECHPYIGGEDPHKFTLTGEVATYPVLNLDKTSSSVVSNEHTIVEDYIIVSNSGDADLVFDIKEIDFDELLTITPLNGTISPNDSQEITLSYDFTEAENGNYTGKFTLLSNDIEHPKTEISLTAILDYIGITDYNNEINIYPNPASDKINIDYKSNQPAKAFIYNILGKQVVEMKLTEGVNVIDIQKLPSSIYFIKINTETFKFIKQ